MNGLIYGRSPNLWLGAFTACFNAIALAAHFTPEIVAAVNLAAGAFIALVAGSDRIQIAAGDAATARKG